MVQISSSIVKFPKQAPPTLILSSHNIPSKVDWDLGVNRALQMIKQNDSSLTKVDYISITPLCFGQIFSLLVFSLLFFVSFLVLQECNLKLNLFFYIGNSGGASSEH